MAIDSINSYLLSSLLAGENVNQTGSTANSGNSAQTEGTDSVETSFKASMRNSLAKAASGKNSKDELDSGSESLEDIFRRASEKYGVSTRLLKAVAKTESNFRTDARSSAGAGGIMQLMPATARAHGVTDLYDPEQNIMAGAEILSSNLNTYNGDLSLALAAYNAGGGNVKKYGGVPPFKETQNYIRKIQKLLGEDEPVLNQTLSKTGGLTGGTSSENSLDSLSSLGDSSLYSLLSGLDESDSDKSLLILELLRQQAMLDASREIGSFDFDEDDGEEI
ncbi:MAG: lytic transglycosylase domain-containing protein [Lachnospiraceae bacterium]|nr:lytic transglycosylase domain-containing protein [Lachnospiraceae bacterium]